MARPATGVVASLLARRRSRATASRPSTTRAADSTGSVSTSSPTRQPGAATSGTTTEHPRACRSARRAVNLRPACEYPRGANLLSGLLARAPAQHHAHLVAEQLVVRPPCELARESTIEELASQLGLGDVFLENRELGGEQLAVLIAGELVQERVRYVAARAEGIPGLGAPLKPGRGERMPAPIQCMTARNPGEDVGPDQRNPHGHASMATSTGHCRGCTPRLALP